MPCLHGVGTLCIDDRCPSVCLSVCLSVPCLTLSREQKAVASWRLAEGTSDWPHLEVKVSKVKVTMSLNVVTENQPYLRNGKGETKWKLHTWYTDGVRRTTRVTDMRCDLHGQSRLWRHVASLMSHVCNVSHKIYRHLRINGVFRIVIFLFLRCYDINIEHRYNVDICCILIQISLHENLVIVSSVTTCREQGILWRCLYTAGRTACCHWAECEAAQLAG